MSADTRKNPKGTIEKRFADIHSHPLPGIDDGAKTLDDSIMMLRCAARYGTSLLVATPHRWYQGRENTPDLLRTLTRRVQTALAQTKFAHRIQLVVGQEVPLSSETAADLVERRALTIGDQGVYALVEPPFDRLDPWTGSSLEAMVAANIRPVLAHPERNGLVQSDPSLVRGFVSSGALIQLTAMSVTGQNGARAQNTAFTIIEEGLATVVASDTHSPTWRPPALRPAYHLLASRYGIEAADRLCIANPRAIALGHRV